MPPKAVRTLRDLVYWQYAKLIAESAGYGKTKNYGFIMDRFKKLKNGEIQWSRSIKEYIKERERPNECIYCGGKESLSADHLIPQSRGGPDTGDNAITACKKCNSSKRDRGIYEWYGLEKRNEIPRIVEGKYLKLICTHHEKEGTLDVDSKNLRKLCEKCGLGKICENILKK